MEGAALYDINRTLEELGRQIEAMNGLIATLAELKACEVAAANDTRGTLSQQAACRSREALMRLSGNA